MCGAVIQRELPPEEWAPGLCGLKLCLLRSEVSDAGVDPLSVVDLIDKAREVRGDDGACYILRNDVPAGRWELTMFDRTGAIG
jgi:hypothetical protein